LRVVMVDEELPYPPTSGKRIRTLNLLIRLAKRHQITYICHRNQDPREAQQAAEYLANHGITSVVVDRPVPPRSGLRFYARLAGNLLSRHPYSVTSHQSRALEDAIRHHARTNHVDLWHCEWTPYVQALPPEIEGPRVVMAHNVESVIWKRYHENESNFLRRWYIGRQWRKWRRFESEALAAVTRTIAVSDVDAERFRNEMNLARVEVVENGVDVGYFKPSPIPRDPCRLLFLGSLDWRPNLDGIRAFLEQVYPSIRSSNAAARFAIVGRNPPSWLHELVLKTPGVELHADVPDVRPFLAECGAMVVPLRIGGGSRLKILEALAAGAPVVSTRIGAEGLHLQPERDFSMSEGMEDLAEQVLRAIASPEAIQAQARRGREEVLRRYDWDVLADQLEGVWLDVVRSVGIPPTPRT
jgi:glycosyltransferase involved in cell wall biosynthesis